MNRAIPSTLSVRVPFAVRRRGGRKLVITPDGETHRPRPRVDSPLVEAVPGFCSLSVHVPVPLLIRGASAVGQASTARATRTGIRPPRLLRRGADGTAKAADANRAAPLPRQPDVPHFTRWRRSDISDLTARGCSAWVRGRCSRLIAAANLTRSGTDVEELRFSEGIGRPTCLTRCRVLCTTMPFWIGEWMMAGGWARDGAVHEQIDASIGDELKRMRSRRAPVGESWTRCAECDEPIPEARGRAVPGVKSCTDCQKTRDARPVHRGESTGEGQRTAS